MGYESRLIRVEDVDPDFAAAWDALPAGDPATGALLAALRHGGYAVASLERSCDYLTRVEGGWEGHRRRFAAYERSVRRLVKRCQPWELRLEEYGGRPGGAARLVPDLRAPGGRDPGRG